MKILHLLKTLTIGGSFTYVARLSAGLSARGHRIVVAAGDELSRPMLDDIGAQLHLVNMSGLHFRRAARQLARIIRDEGIDVVNAHHWTAGAAGYLAARDTGRPFLLSVHGTRHALQRWLVFYWSPKVLVVSRSGRENLVHQLGVPPERVIESFIGVDTHRFAPGASSPSLLAELGLLPEQPVVLHVSRFGPTKSHVAMALADAAPALAEAVPGVAVLLVGAGEDEARVLAAAERANARLGRPVVRSTGARTDIPELMRLADVVVGTASVGLEAMASACPLVGAGKFGFVGTVTPENFAAANACCFGDHRAELPVTPAALADAVIPLLADPARRQALGGWGRGLMVEQFSLERMTDQIETIYQHMVNGGVHWGGELT